jgi:endonuclease/exonuclease/phosphatase family metal-dependent hydrolase
MVEEHIEPLALRVPLWICLCGYLVSACEPLYTTWPAREGTHVRSAATLSPTPAQVPAALAVMTWNIKFAAARIDFFFDLWGDRVQMTHDEVTGNLANIIALVNQVNPDILLVQEIEVNSRRSAYVDMVRAILEGTPLNHAIYVSTWKSRYVAEEGLGRVDMGNAIFSRYPIVAGERIALPERSDLDPLTAAFYLHRAVGRAVIDVGGTQVAALVVHTEAYDTDGTKSRQLQALQGLLETEPLPFVVGGDFNAIPPGSLDRQAFNDEHPDSIGSSFEQPPYDLADMQPFYDRYLPAISLQRYGDGLESQRRHFTHSVLGRHQVGARGEAGFWNRRLDYLFVKPPGAWLPQSTDTLQEPGRLGIRLDPMLLSDHCPVVGGWQVAP